MKRISAYEATDGTLFNSKKACQDHQRAINVIEGVQAVAKNIEADPFYLCEDLGVGAYAITDSFQLAHFILANAEAIKLALDGKPVPSAVEPEDDGLEAVTTTIADLSPEEAFVTAA